jgi:hypothetical protein
MSQYLRKVTFAGDFLKTPARDLLPGVLYESIGRNMACGECLFRDIDNRTVIVLPQATVANLYDNHGFKVETINELLKNLDIGVGSSVSKEQSDSISFKLLIVGAIPTSQANPKGMAFIMSNTTLLPLLEANNIKLGKDYKVDTSKCFNDIGKEVATRYRTSWKRSSRHPDSFRISLAEWKALQPDIANHIDTVIARIDIGDKTYFELPDK